MSVRNLGRITDCCMFAFLGTFIHLEKDNDSHTPSPDQNTFNEFVIQLGAITSIAETVSSGDRIIANWLLFT